MRRVLQVVVLFLVLMVPGLARGQSLSDDFAHLFTFGDCGQPLCLETNQEHGLHYIPSITQGENDLLSFLTGSIATSLGNLPFTAASSGVTVRLVDGMPVANAVSGGPIFAERAQTLGRGRFLAGVNVNGVSFSQVRGVPLSDLQFEFAHQNVQDPALGDPTYERDVIQVTTNLKLDLLVTSVYASYGLLPGLDVSVLVPIVRSSIDGTSDARVIPYTRPTPHLFAGNSETASSSTHGSATGLGDINLRLKSNLYQTEQMGVGLLADVRLPTGSEADFLGSGETSIRLVGIVSGNYGKFSPHLNTGMDIRSGSHQNNSVLATLGFDQLVSDRVSLAAELITDIEVGASNLRLPAPAIFTAPTVESVSLTQIPDKSDSRMDLAFGGKFALPGSYLALANILFPINDGGLRPKYLWTIGIEKTF